MSSADTSESELENHFKNPLSFFDDISEELSQENAEMAQLYGSAIEELPVIDFYYSERKKSFSGGMKSIEQAWDKSAKRKVALAWPKSLEVSLKDKIIFLNEARVTAALEHPNIMPVYEVGRNEDLQPLFVMKWLDGVSLEQCLNDKAEKAKKSLDELLTSMIKVCEAIEYAHANGVIHLDLKPGNIQLGSFGEVLVLDWGLARLIKTDHLSKDELKIHNSIEVFLKSRLRGTLDFISPEREQGMDPDMSMDIYSLGVLLKEVLAYCQDDISSSEKSSIKSISDKASAYNKEDRYSSVAGIKKDIQGFLHGFAVKAEGPGLLKLLTLFIKRHRPVFFTAALAFVSIVVLTFVFINNLQRSEDNERQSRLLAEGALNDLEAENKLKQALLKKLSIHIVNKQREEQERLNFKTAIARLAQLAVLDSKSVDVWFELARLKLGTLDFDGALECFKKLDELGAGDAKIIARVKLCAEKFKDVVEWQQSDHLDLLNELRGLLYIKATVCKTLYSQMNIKEQVDFFLKAMETRYPGLKFEYEITGNSVALDFSSKTGVIKFPAAAGLSVSRLNLSNTKRISLRFFQHHSLKYLDLSNSDIDDLLAISSLEELNAQNLKADELKATKEQWQNLRKLNLSGCQFKSWLFLHACHSLEELDISQSNIILDSTRLPSNIKTLFLDEKQVISERRRKLFTRRGITIKRL